MRGPDDPLQDHGWCPPALALVPVRSMLLVVVGLDPAVMDMLEFRPRGRLAEVPVGHGALDAEGRLDGGLPGILALNQLVGDAERGIDGIRLRRVEDAILLQGE